MNIAPNNNSIESEVPSIFETSHHASAKAEVPCSGKGLTCDAIDSFDEMGLREEILRGIYSCGFEKPSAIQQQAIQPAMKGHDMIAQAQSGTGKTAAFTIGALANLDPASRKLQVLILAPTRELVGQTQRVVNALGDYMHVEVFACKGGTSTREGIRALRNDGVQIVVGTPGRVLDMIQHRHMETADLRQVIIDEADEMLSAGFKGQVYDIFKYLSENVQVCLFSATMPLEVLELTKKFLRDPVRILCKKEELSLDGIKQFYIACDREEWKLDVLCDLYSSLSIAQAIIYRNTRGGAEWLENELQRRDFTVSCIHGDMDQRDRDVVMREFRTGSSRVLIATDLLARGIDVQQVSLVINYDIPLNRESYIHRIGRAGRFGRKGVAINFVTDRDSFLCLRDIERHYETQIDEMPNNVNDYM